MPFESDRQRRFMFARHPKIARRWVAEAKEEGVSPTKHKRKNVHKSEGVVHKSMDLVEINKALKTWRY